MSAIPLPFYGRRCYFPLLIVHPWGTWADKQGCWRPLALPGCISSNHGDADRLSVDKPGTRRVSNEAGINGRETKQAIADVRKGKFSISSRNSRQKRQKSLTVWLLGVSNCRGNKRETQIIAGEGEARALCLCSCTRVREWEKKWVCSCTRVRGWVCVCPTVFVYACAWKGERKSDRAHAPVHVRAVCVCVEVVSPPKSVLAHRKSIPPWQQAHAKHVASGLQKLSLAFFLINIHFL